MDLSIFGEISHKIQGNSLIPLYTEVLTRFQLEVTLWDIQKFAISLHYFFSCQLFEAEFKSSNLHTVDTQLAPYIEFYWQTSRLGSTVEIVYNETDHNEQRDITSRFGAEVRSRRCTLMIIAISVITIKVGLILVLIVDNFNCTLNKRLRKQSNWILRNNEDAIYLH